MNVDEIFKSSRFPSAGSKRKLPDNPTPELLKKMKMDIPSTSDNTSHGTYVPTPKVPRSVTVEDVTDEESDARRADFAPGGDADYFAEEDDEGRFFGGGLTSEQKEILNIFDSAGGEGVQEPAELLSATAVRRSLLRLERSIHKNQDQRSKYPNDPTRFIDSEADLDNAIKSLLPLAQAPGIAYPELVRSDTVALLIGLFTHENLDIVIDVVELIHELTDDDESGEIGDEETREDAEEAMKVLIEALIDNSILELLVENLTRMNEAEESDKQGVFHVLAIFENILSFNPELTSEFASKTNILAWILNRIQAKKHDENRGYAAELLSILLQNSPANRVAFGREDGVEILLKILSQYRRKDPADQDEVEFMENLFDALCSALNEPSIKQLFLAAEGQDLMILMMKEKLQSKSRSIKTLDHAMSGSQGSAVCVAFIEALGLKSLFSAFMGKTNRKGKTTVALPPSEDVGHILGIISSLLSNLDSESTGRIRLLAKFVEGNYEKVDKLVDIRDSARSRLKQTDAEIDAEKKAFEADDDEILKDEDVWYLRRLDGGLFTLQTVDYILAWILMEDDGIRTHVLQMLNRKNQSLQDIVATLQIYYDNVDDASITSKIDQGEQAPSQKEILQNLIAALNGT